jgi:hypothetical protein
VADVKQEGQPLQGALAFLVVGGFGVMLGTLMMFPIPSEATQLVNTFMGVLGTMAVTVVNFYYGSSKTSQIKDTTISNLTGASNGVAKSGDPGTVDVQGQVKGTLTEKK